MEKTNVRFYTLGKDARFTACLFKAPKCAFLHPVFVSVCNLKEAKEQGDLKENWLWPYTSAWYPVSFLWTQMCRECKIPKLNFWCYLKSIVMWNLTNFPMRPSVWKWIVTDIALLRGGVDHYLLMKLCLYHLCPNVSMINHYGHMSLQLSSRHNSLPDSEPKIAFGKCSHQKRLQKEFMWWNSYT